MFECIEGTLTGGSPDKRSIFAAEFIQRECDMRVFENESAPKIASAEEGLDITKFRRSGPIEDSSNFQGVGSGSTFGKIISVVLDSFFLELALRRLAGQTSCLHDSKDFMGPIA